MNGLCACFAGLFKHCGRKDSVVRSPCPCLLLYCPTLSFQTVLRNGEKTDNRQIGASHGLV
jgi:hypothetical protein